MTGRSGEVEYTSLRDILGENPGPPPIVPPTNSSSWNNNEIPIKNPLVKQAALAYLHVTPTPSYVSPDTCSCPSCFFHFLNALFFKPIAHFFVTFCKLRGMDDTEQDHCDGDGHQGQILH